MALVRLHDSIRAHIRERLDRESRIETRSHRGECRAAPIGPPSVAVGATDLRPTDETEVAVVEIVVVEVVQTMLLRGR